VQQVSAAFGVHLIRRGLHDDAKLIATNASKKTLFVKRGLATVLDTIIMLLMLVLAEGVLGRALYAKTWFLWIAFPIAYMVGLEGTTGAALGKRAMGLCVVGRDGRPPGLVKQATRFALWLFEVLAFPVVAALFVLISRSGRRIGDVLADTFVVESHS
jgi:uncharacterized RDD family membrane protein YckC